uniref:hypothetical protein n=1 Tax=Streptobacillus moniliformis TaxID=34105 RepID=UPI0018C885F0
APLRQEPVDTDEPEDLGGTTETVPQPTETIPLEIPEEPTDEVPPEPEPECEASRQTTIPPSFGTFDGKDLRPRTVLYVHIAEAAVRDGHGLVRPEHGSAQSLDQLLDWLGEIGCAVQV